MAQYSLATFDLDDDEMWIYCTWIVFGSSYLVLSCISYFWLEYKRYEMPENSMAVSADLKTVKKELKKLRSEEVSGASFRKVEDDMDGYILHSKTPTTLSDTFPTQRESPPVPVLEHPRAEDDLTMFIPRDGNSGFVPVTLAFQDLWYSVPGQLEGEIDLVRGVTGFALPGTMTAIMGDAGTGKTTLLDVLAGRRTSGNIRGDIYLNGYSATDLATRRCTGYGDRMDIHSDSATIREAMFFAAMLRQDAAISSIEKLVHVEECIDLLELRPIANRIIRGSTKEVMKRVTIGVEMAASPSLLLMDEPTSGLDARSAMRIMNGLRKIADTGRTVICTLHQPTSDVFNLFDSLLLLQKGGRMAFFGETGDESTKVIEYFARVPGVQPLQAGHNPASWVLDTASGAARRSRKTAGADVAPGTAMTFDFVSYFEASDLSRLLAEDLDQDGLTRPSHFLPEIRFDTKRAARPTTQFVMLLKRFFRMYWRTPMYNLTRLTLSVVLSGLFGVMYQGTKYATFKGANAGVGMIFLSTIFFGLIGFNSVLPIAAAERSAFYRERASQTYNALWYFIASTIAEIPYVLLSGLLFTSILFPLVGFEGLTKFVFYWIVTSLHVLLQIYMGQFLVYVLPSVQAASALGALLSSVFLLFAGFNPPTSKIPTVYKWIHYISPPSYTISALTASVFADCPTPGGTEIGCQPLQNAPLKLTGATLKQYIESVFNMKHDLIWQNVAIIYALTVGFRVLALLALRYVRHDKR